MKNFITSRSYLSLGAAVMASLGLSACMSIGYRCPLDPNEKAEAPTACKNMQDALTGAKKGSGGRTSVFLDDKGRIVPRELLEQRVASPLVANKGTPDPYYPSSGEPAFQQPRVYQVWSSSFVDAEGNLHDGHNAWFTTPGRWTRGSMDTPTSTGENVMRPSVPNERPKGRVITTDGRARADAAPAPAQAPAKKESDASALQALAQAANSSASHAATKAAPAKPQAGGVTAPAVMLND